MLRRIVALVLLLFFFVEDAGGQYKQWIQVTPLRSGISLWPVARTGHTALYWQNKMILFGGLTADSTYLNDVWEYDFARQEWENIMPNEDPSAWFINKDVSPTAEERRGVVPARPAGRYGHTAVFAQVPNDVGNTIDVMTIFGGQSTNCSDYCRDIWHYSLQFQTWTILYGEWWGQIQVFQQMYNYTLFGSTLPVKRWLHAAISNTTHLFIWGGNTVGDDSACCSWTCPTAQIYPDADCTFLRDFWITSLSTFIPFEAQISTNKHTIQSSTYLNGYAQLAVDGNTYNVFQPNGLNNTVSHTQADSQAWWQVDLGWVRYVLAGSVHMCTHAHTHTTTTTTTNRGNNFVTNLTIYNRGDDESERLSNFYVLLSQTPFSSDRLEDLLKDPQVWKFHVMYIVQQEVTVYVNELGTYLRIQLAGTDFLSLAEVSIYGYPPVEDWQAYEGIRRWFELPNDISGPKPRAGHGMIETTVDSVQKFIMFGGYVNEAPYYLNDWWEYSFDVYKWIQIEPVSASTLTGRFGHTMTNYEDQIIIFGGQAGYSSIQQPPDSTTTQQLFQSGYLNDLWLYNITSNVASLVNVQNLANGPPGRTGHSLIVSGNNLVLFGGSSDILSQCPNGVCSDMWTYTFVTAASCPDGCSNHGVCEFGFCICDIYRTGDGCEDIRCPQTTCVYDYASHVSVCDVCSNHGTCLANGTCACDQGYGASENCAYLTCGNNLNCSNHGVCKGTGDCECDGLWAGVDCNIATCLDNCSQQGDCVTTISTTGNVTACVCGDAFTGEDCSEELADYYIGLEGADGGASRVLFTNFLVLFNVFAILLAISISL